MRRVANSALDSDLGLINLDPTVEIYDIYGVSSLITNLR